MCKHGVTVPVRVVIPAQYSHTGMARVAVVGVDACIAPIIRRMHERGVMTAGCCCGHGKTEASVILADGRVITL